MRGRNQPTVETYSSYITKADGATKPTLLQGLEFINWKGIVRKDSVVFVKPNFTFPRYRKGITTSPLLLKDLLGILRDRCRNVMVGESDGGNRSFKAEEAFAGHQMYEMAKEVGVELVNLSKYPASSFESEVQSRKVRVQLPKILLEKVDCLISVPVLKVHSLTGVSLSIKNLWGCVPDTMRVLHHKNLDRKLSLISRLLNPRIAVIDGIYGLNGHGPMFGSPIKMDLVLISNNVVVADAIGAMIMGVSLRRAKHIIVGERGNWHDQFGQSEGKH